MPSPMMTCESIRGYRYKSADPNLTRVWLASENEFRRAGFAEIFYNESAEPGIVVPGNKRLSGCLNTIIEQHIAHWPASKVGAGTSYPKIISGVTSNTISFHREGRGMEISYVLHYGNHKMAYAYMYLVIAESELPKLNAWYTGLAGGILDF